MIQGSKSIFHLGDEVENPLSMDPSDQNLVGLRILIQNPSDVQRKVVTKSSSLKSCGSTTVLPQSSEAAQEFGFLKTCYLCKNDLNPQKDVYMYRGNQGFCSLECRLRQIMLDESREFQATGSVDHHSSTAEVGGLEKIRKTSLLA